VKKKAPAPKKVVIIGSGNVAEALVRALDRTPYRVVQIVARNRERGEALAFMAGCIHVDSLAALSKADIYLLAVSDNAIAELAAAGDFGDGVVAHTAGGVDIDALAAAAPAATAGCGERDDERLRTDTKPSDIELARMAEARRRKAAGQLRIGRRSGRGAHSPQPETPTAPRHRAVLYPVQTFTAGREVDFSRIPILIEGSDPAALEAIEGLARTLSGSVRYADSALRAQVHLAAVFACNFSNFLYSVSEKILKDSGLEFDLLKPLIEECAQKAIAAPSPALTQTGPAVRGDTQTQTHHLQMLHDENMKTIYRTLSDNIWKTLRKR